MKYSVKKTFAAILLAAVMMSPANAAADVVILPYSNDFYRENQEKCIYIKQRKYTVLKDSDILESPAGNNVIMTVGEGDVIIIDYAYTDSDGNVWGSYCYDADLYGWIPMENAELIYDRYSFDEEHSEEYEEYNGELDGYLAENRVVLWTYPNSETVLQVFSADYWNEDEYRELQSTWTDENGDKWIYAGYRYYGWIYLPDIEGEMADIDMKPVLGDIGYDEPTAEIEVTEPAPEELQANKEAVESTISPETNNGYLVPIVLSAAAAAFSAGALYLLGKKKSK